MDFSIQPISLSDIGATDDSAIRKTSVVSQPGISAQAQAPQAAQPIQDTVKLSTTSQIQSLKQGGATVAQIAANLGVSATEVDQALGITSSSSSTEASVLAALSSHR